MSDHCKNSIEYIIRNAVSFDYAAYYSNFCDGFTREQTRDKLKADLEICNFECGACDAGSMKWIQEQLNFDAPLERSLKVDAFWLAMAEKQNVIRSAINKEIRKTAIYEKLHQDAMSGIAATCQEVHPLLNEQAEQAEQAEQVDHADHIVVESDTLVTFEGISIASILKSEGKCLFARYNTLSEDEKTRCGYCLSGILDVSSDIQHCIFTPKQWTFLADRFKSTGSPYEQMQDIEVGFFIAQLQNELILKCRYEEAYHAVLIEITKSTDPWLLKVLAHVLNCYIEQRRMFQNAQNTTGHDYMATIWYELFELMFGGQGLQINWGQSASSAIAQPESTNSSSNNSTIVCTVNEGPVACIRNVLDVGQSGPNCPSLVNSDLKRNQAALAIESKCILDDILHKQAPQCEIRSVQSLLINGREAQAFSLSLVDSGLYINIQDFDFSLPSEPSAFAAGMFSWVKKVISFHDKCLLNYRIRTSTVDSSPTNSSKAVPPVPSSWTRGAFLFPNKGQTARFPDNFLSSISQPQSRNNNVSENYLMNDKTSCRERKKQQHHGGSKSADQKKRDREPAYLKTHAEIPDSPAVKRRSVRHSQSKTGGSSSENSSS